MKSKKLALAALAVLSLLLSNLSLSRADDVIPSPDHMYYIQVIHGNRAGSIKLFRANGQAVTSDLDIGSRSGFKEPIWSPNSKRFAYEDSGVKIVDISGKRKKLSSFIDPPVAFNVSGVFQTIDSMSWSPDGKLLAYSVFNCKTVANQMAIAGCKSSKKVFLYSVEDSRKPSILSCDNLEYSSLKSLSFVPVLNLLKESSGSSSCKIVDWKKVN